MVLEALSKLPKNFRLIASMDDDNKETILANKLRYSKVVYSVEQAKEERLPIDYDDSIACCKDTSFALLIHGGQPKGSDAGKAVSSAGRPLSVGTSRRQGR